MADNTQEWRQAGQGPHPTLAGNVLDPHVRADGQKGGVGVGGTSGENIRQEGQEHIQQQSSGYSQPSDYQNTSFDGLGSTGAVAGSSGYGSGTTSRLGEDSYNSTSGGYGSNTGSEFTKTSGTESNPVGDSYTPENTSTAGIGGSDVGNYSNPKAPVDSDVTTGSDPIESADPSSVDTQRGLESKGGQGAEVGGETAEKRGEKPPPIGGGHQKLDNPDSIPTAGGEKLGKQHWGESKMISDNPKLSNEDSAVDQSTSENTAANTGDVAHHEGLVEKMKHMIGK